MNHSGSSPCPEEECPDSITCATDDSQSAFPRGNERKDRESIGFRTRNSAHPVGFDWMMPIRAARADARTVRDSLPFVVQSGQALFIIAENSAEWIVAELHFDPADCIFLETRRASYQWPREAFGRLMSVALIGDLIEPGQVEQVSDAFGKWLAGQFAAERPDA